MFTLAKIWIWIKEHWKIISLFIWTIVVWAVSRKNAEATLRVLETRKESYNKQIAELKKSHQKELTEKDKLILEYHDIIEKLEIEFEKKERALTEVQKKSVKKLVETSRGDPDEIKRRIEEEFGIKYVE